jgi:hypothetical protein
MLRKLTIGVVAQCEERLPKGREVTGSSPVNPTGDVAQSGRVSALQAEGRGFESRRLLCKFNFWFVSASAGE